MCACVRACAYASLTLKQSITATPHTQRSKELKHQKEQHRQREGDIVPKEIVQLVEQPPATAKIDLVRLGGFLLVVGNRAGVANGTDGRQLLLGPPFATIHNALLDVVGGDGLGPRADQLTERADGKTNHGQAGDGKEDVECTRGPVGRVQIAIADGGQRHSTKVPAIVAMCEALGGQWPTDAITVSTAARMSWHCMW
jgi:hypothetical protein